MQVKTINFLAQQEFKYDACALRGLYLFVVRVLDGSPLADDVAVPRSFFVRNQTITLRNEMYLSEKNIQYADLFMAFIKCPFDKADDDCPFEQYWKVSDIEKQLNTMQDLPDNELDELQKHHRICLLNKVRRIREGE